MSARLAGWLRRLAAAARWAPGMRSLTPLWAMLRGPYRLLFGVLGRHAGVEVRIGGDVVRIDASIAMAGWERSEPEGYAAWRAMLTPGATALDIGAWAGTYAILAARAVGPTGRVLAYEPVPGTRHLLERHVRINGVSERVTVRPVAMGATPGEVTLWITSDVGDSEAGTLRRAGARALIVPRSTVDIEAASVGARVHAIKVDVEGQELDVLAGARATLERDRPTLLVSVHPQALAEMDRSPDEVFALLTAARYDTRIIAHEHEVHCLATPIPD